MFIFGKNPLTLPRFRTAGLFLALTFFVLPCMGGQELCPAVRAGDVQAVADMLDAGADIREVEAWGTEERTALMVAADQMDMVMFKFLLDRGAPLDQASPEYRRTLLMHLAGLPSTYDETRLPMASLALQRSAKTDLKDSNGWTALRYAVESTAGPRMISLLLSSRANPDLGDDQETRPLHQAIETGQPEAVKALLEGGAGPDLLMRSGRSRIGALHLAVDRADYEAVRMLLSHKANINLQTTGSFGGQTALHRAVENRDVDMVRLLLSWQPRLDLKDNGGYTVLDYAKEGGGSELQEILAALAKAGKSGKSGRS